jgi:Zn-dependent protease
MARRLRLANAFGIEMAIDSTWVLSLILAAWTLVTVAGHALPSASSAAVTVVGVAAAIGVFASLAVHELAHGLLARTCGVPVRRVTLFVFGGITDVEHAPASPRSEAIAAALAPLVNAFAGVVLLAISAAVAIQSPALALLLSWIGAANLAIVALNVLPAYPLDGGRVLRAVLWRATADEERATRWSAWAGQVVGWSLVAAGVVLTFVSHGDRVAAAMWLAFVGWFITSASARAYAGVITKHRGVTTVRWHQGALES